MRMSRRQFTREFKEAAVRRLELGASLAEVARACEVNPNVLHRWKRELHEHRDGPRAEQEPAHRDRAAADAGGRRAVATVAGARNVRTLAIIPRRADVDARFAVVLGSCSLAHLDVEAPQHDPGADPHAPQLGFQRGGVQGSLLDAAQERPSVHLEVQVG